MSASHNSLFLIIALFLISNFYSKKLSTYKTLDNNMLEIKTHWEGMEMNSKMAAEVLDKMITGRGNTEKGPKQANFTIINKTKYMASLVKATTTLLKGWNEAWPLSIYGNSQVINTPKVPEPLTLNDTNSVALYTMKCNNTAVQFTIEIRKLFVRLNWIRESAWNSCFDLAVSGSIDQHDYFYNTLPIDNILVSGTLSIPLTPHTKLDLKIVNRQEGNRYIMVYRECDYFGFAMAYPRDEEETENPEFAYKFKRRIASVRVPPGLVLTLFEKPHFEGESIKLTRDYPCLSSIGWLDRAESLKLEGASSS
jgi:hypothetical protein